MLQTNDGENVNAINRDYPRHRSGAFLHLLLKCLLPSNLFFSEKKLEQASSLKFCSPCQRLEKAKEILWKRHLGKLPITQGVTILSILSA